MEVIPASRFLRRQLLLLRNEAQWARQGLIQGQPPPHGFSVQVASAFQALAGVTGAGGTWATEIPSEARLSTGDVDRIIERLDLALREVAGDRVFASVDYRGRKYDVMFVDGNCMVMLDGLPQGLAQLDAQGKVVATVEAGGKGTERPEAIVEIAKAAGYGL